jgi:hypothetical protein
MRAELASKRDLAESLRQQAGARRNASVTRVMYRLHSEEHYIDCSDTQFAEWIVRQRDVPVHVTTRNGLRWWWFMDQFWWVDKALTPHEARALVFRFKRESQGQRRAHGRELGETLGGERTVLPESLLSDVPAKRATE